MKNGSSSIPPEVIQRIVKKLLGNSSLFGSRPPLNHRQTMYRSAISGQAVTPDFAYSHPRTTEADSIDYPSIKNRPTRILHRRVDTGEIVTAAFAALFPDITVREVVPVYSLFD